MEARLWNIGAKVADVAAEIDFYVGLGGRLMLHEKLTTPEGESEYAIVFFGGTRLFLTPKPIFEDRLATASQPGLSHAVFEVADLDPEVARLQAGGAEMLIPPTALAAGFGKRRIAFFRSPGGLVFEVMEITESTPAVEAP
jgi:catechol 2,3-dioxygenase-like lactoylglutathione lyase family enzyme